MAAGCLESSGNITKHLKVTDEGKLKWSGTFENLSILMDKLLNKQVQWTSPSGDCRRLKYENFVLRWYSKSKTLTITGEGSEDLKSQLRVIVNVNESETLPSENQHYIENDELDAEYNNAKNVESKILVNQDDRAASVLGQMRRLEERFESKFERLVKEIQEIKFANASEACNDTSQQEHKTSLKNENITLKKENTGLAEQVNDYKFIVTDMKAKIKDFKNERNSLITVIKILQEDQKYGETNKWNVVGGQKETPTRLENQPGRTENKRDSRINRCSILSDSDEDNEVNKASQARTPHNKNKRRQSGKAQTKTHVNPPRLEKSHRPMHMENDTLNADSNQPNERHEDSSRRANSHHPTNTGLDTKCQPKPIKDSHFGRFYA